jgi:hypothetical protein
VQCRCVNCLRHVRLPACSACAVFHFTRDRLPELGIQ